MNRAQRRAEAKTSRHTRARRMGREGVDRYVQRARRKMLGMSFVGMPIDDELHGKWRFPATTPLADRASLAEYAEAAPHRWHITATARFQADDGVMYIEQIDGEVGQVALLAELQGEWQRLLAEARGAGNPNHLHSELVELRPL